MRTEARSLVSCEGTVGRPSTPRTIHLTYTHDSRRSGPGECCLEYYVNLYVTKAGDPSVLVC